MTSGSWRTDNIGDQSGRTILITGPSPGGLGHAAALALAGRGARVILAGRNAAKIEETTEAIRAEHPAAALDSLTIDLADLASVRRAAAEAGRFGAIDVLINNAGVMATPHRRTVDDLELQLATNHFGPFLLTGLLLPQLTASRGATVVAVSSLAHHLARRVPLSDPHRQSGRYWRWPVYGESKLANLLFTYELDRRARAAGLPLKATAAHPGGSATHLAANGQFGRSSGGIASIYDAAVRAVLQSATAGAAPILMAATADLPGATYCGPSGPGEVSGPPRVVSSNRLSHNDTAARQLWELSEQVTGVEYP